jgi:hypothetical protein
MSGGHQPVEENNPNSNDSSPLTDPGKSYAPVDDAVTGGSPGGAEQDPIGMVRCRSCGMQTPANGARCQRCNTPVRASASTTKQYNGQ